jgi:hypothetical protein
MRLALLLVAGAVAIAGCGGTASPAASVATTSSSTLPPAPSTTTTVATTTAPRVSTSAEVAWAAALGPGVTITPPGSTPPPGTTGPGGVVEAEIADQNAGKLVEACSLLEPSVQATCTQAVAGHAPAGATLKNFSLGYIVVKGDEALVGALGTNCNPTETPKCSTNLDPAAIFSSGQTFDALYAAALAAQANSSVNSYSLAPCIEVASRWYINVPASDL